MRIAIVGTGISGLGAAHRLHGRVDFDMFEAGPWIGGHTHTVDVPFPDGPVPVDTGFIVYNTVTYPLLTALFDELGVATETSDMSFSITGSRPEYEGSLRGMFADPRAATDPQHWRMIRDIMVFNRRVRAAAAGGQAVEPGTTLGAFTADLSDAFRKRYLIPMCAAIWSTPDLDVTDYPAHTLIRFFANHGLVQLRDRPQWRTVTGGARTYVEALTRPFRHRIHTDTPVREIRRTPAGVDVVLDDAIASYDGVLLATHADTSLKLLNGAASRLENEVLSAFSYSTNRAVLHSDPAVMPRRRKAWASWNVEVGAGPVSVSYWMNRLQNLETPEPVFVSLNPSAEPRHRHGSWMYDHPMFDAGAVAAQKRLPELQGRDRFWFAGAYFRYGFHEDGLMAGYAAADALLTARVEV